MPDLVTDSTGQFVAFHALERKYLKSIPVGLLLVLWLRCPGLSGIWEKLNRSMVPTKAEWQGVIF